MLAVWNKDAGKGGIPREGRRLVEGKEGKFFGRREAHSIKWAQAKGDRGEDLVGDWAVGVTPR